MSDSIKFSQTYIYILVYTYVDITRECHRSLAGFFNDNELSLKIYKFSCFSSLLTILFVFFFYYHIYLNILDKPNAHYKYLLIM